MELLLRLITPRKVFVALLALGFAHLLARYIPDARKAFVDWRYPAVAVDGGAQAGALDMAADRARQLQAHVQALAAGADAGLAAARARGDDVSALDLIRSQAAAVAASDPQKAADLLNQIIAQTPAEPMGLIPIEHEDAQEEQIEPDVPGQKTNQYIASGKKKRRRRRQ